MTSPRFEHRIKVTAGDLDELGHVNNVVYVRYVQEVAEAHWRVLTNEALREKYLWVVLRHEIDYKNPAFVNEVIKATTWVGEHNGARSERFVTLVSEASGKLLVEAKTVWCMLDAKSMRPMRITDEVIQALVK